MNFAPAVLSKIIEYEDLTVSQYARGEPSS
jgi:hypothetical protein